MLIKFNATNRRGRILWEVLLVEDDSSTAKSIEMILKSEGYMVETTDLGKMLTNLENFMNTTLSCLIWCFPICTATMFWENSRAEKINIPILILSGLANWTTKSKDWALEPTIIWPNHSKKPNWLPASKQLFAAPKATPKAKSKLVALWSILTPAPLKLTESPSIWPGKNTASSNFWPYAKAQLWPKKCSLITYTAAWTNQKSKSLMCLSANYAKIEQTTSGENYIRNCLGARLCSARTSSCR